MNRHVMSEIFGCDEYQQLERRALLKSAWKLSAAAALSAPAWLPRMAFAADENSARDLIVCVFLRGGADGLSTCVPFGDADYYNARNVLAVPPPDAATALKAIDLDGYFGLPPAFAPLKPIYDAGQLAIVHASGLNDDTRSHFEAQGLMEGGDLNQSQGSGWLARHLLSVNASPEIAMRAMAASIALPRSLAGAPKAVAIPGIDNYGLIGRAQTTAERQAFLAALYEGFADPVQSAATNVAATIDLISGISTAGYVPANDAVYPEDAWGLGLRSIAQIAKADVGLEVACIDLGGWDTHAFQGTLDGQLNNLMTNFANGLAAFHADMQDRMDSTTLVVLSEFGRRVAENFSLGCDHGHGNAMFVLGGNINGGQVHADWPGLHTDLLDDGRDLAITTDYRDVLAEILNKRAANNAVDLVFPGYTPTIRNIVSGT